MHDTEIAIVVTIILAIILVTIVAVFCPPPPRPPKPQVKIPSARQVGTAVGKTTGNLGIGFVKGVVKAFKDGDRPKGEQK